MFILRSFFPHVVLYIGILILDQWTKWFFASTRASFTFTSFFRFVYVENRGIAFSLPLTGTLLQVVTVLLLLLILWGIVHFQIYKKPLLFFFVIMVLGGAVGNAIDRISLGYVVDFISVGSFPVFNVADSFVTLGALGILFSSWKEDRLF